MDFCFEEEARREEIHSLARRSNFGLEILQVDGVDGPVIMIALDVRVNVGAMLADVNAVRALEARRLAALVLEMPVQTAVPLVDLAALGAFEGTR